jgi:hypothetical protein
VPPQTMQVTLAPRGFLPEPAQKTHGLMGSCISTSPVPLQTRQCEICESKSKGSLPVPLQNAHFIFFAITQGITNDDLRFTISMMGSDCFGALSGAEVPAWWTLRESGHFACAQCPDFFRVLVVVISAGSRYYQFSELVHHPIKLLP